MFIHKDIDVNSPKKTVPPCLSFLLEKMTVVYLLISDFHFCHFFFAFTVSRAKQLYQFLVELLKNEDYCPKYIDWVSREERIFKLVDSTAVAQLWGGCKNRENMTYEKMSRALRYYYENGILERVPNIRLHYRFGQVVLDEYGGDL